MPTPAVPGDIVGPPSRICSPAAGSATPSCPAALPRAVHVPRRCPSRHDSVPALCYAFRAGCCSQASLPSGLHRRRRPTDPRVEVVRICYGDPVAGVGQQDVDPSQLLTLSAQSPPAQSLPTVGRLSVYRAAAGGESRSLLACQGIADQSRLVRGISTSCSTRRRSSGQSSQHGPLGPRRRLRSRRCRPAGNRQWAGVRTGHVSSRRKSHPHTVLAEEREARRSRRNMTRRSAFDRRGRSIWTR